MEYLHLPKIESTNTYVKQHAGELADMVMVWATEQTAGRGQRGNSWESEPGKNLTFTLFYRHNSYPAREQFAISEAVALAICDSLVEMGIPADEVSVKWPNDIYVGDKKICGILIEHAVSGNGLMHSIIGAGINVNQDRFVSDAPNPVSIKQIIGKEIPLDNALSIVSSTIERGLSMVTRSQSGRQAMHRLFMTRLWRGDGNFYPFKDAATGECFDARIADIDPQGFLQLATKSGETRTYAFKEVAFIL